MQTLQQTYNHEGEGFWYRGEYYSWGSDYGGGGGGFAGSSGGTLNSGTYSYNATKNAYYDGYGREVSFKEVLYEYIIPIGVQIDWMTISGSASNPYQHIGMVYYTDVTKEDWNKSIDQSWNLPTNLPASSSINTEWIDKIGSICAGALEFAIGFLGSAEVGLVRSAFTKSGANVVYQGLDAAGAVRYIGITERAPAVRWLEHVNSGTARSMLDYRVIEGATNLTRTEARIWEQTLINQYGLSKNGGLLLNKINSIAPRYWWQYGINP